MSCRRERLYGTHIARSCTLTLARIHSRRRRKNKPNGLVPWWVPPAPSPSPSLRLPPRSSRDGSPGLLVHLRLRLPLLLEGMSLTSRLKSDVYRDGRTYSLRAVFHAFFEIWISPPPLCLGGVRTGGGGGYPTAIIDFIMSHLYWFWWVSHPCFQQFHISMVSNIFWFDIYVTVRLRLYLQFPWNKVLCGSKGLQYCICSVFVVVILLARAFSSSLDFQKHKPTLDNLLVRSLGLDPIISQWCDSGCIFTNSIIWQNHISHLQSSLDFNFHYDNCILLFILLFLWLYSCISLFRCTLRITQNQN